jgi:hypothetical protein
VEADIALDAAVVLSLGMNRVAGKAAGLTAIGADALAALAEGRAEARAAALAEAEQRDRAMRAVIERNARIGVLADAQRGAGVTLPAPLPPGDQRTAELQAWCAATDQALAEAEQEISARLAESLTATIFDVPAAGLRTELGQAERATVERATVERATADYGQAAALVRVLARLAPEAADADRAHVQEAAERLADAGTDGEAEALLSEVRLRVQQANKRTAERGEEERRLAAEREAEEQAEAERRYVLDTVTEAFAELGYKVDEGFETMTARDGEVVLTKGSWPDHSVKMHIEDAGALRAAMVRTRQPRSEDDRRRDAEREQEWCDAFEAARERLTAAGVHTEVTWRIEPGEHELPVTAEARQTRARTERAKQREREI